jgi:hypothetical protein
MQHAVQHRASTGPAVLGFLLIVVGGAALLTQAAGVNLVQWFGPMRWPFLVVIPGLVLLAAAVIPSRPNGIGFAIAGAIVTTVGLILLYQSETGHWESWAYAWALIPGAAGVAQIVYGLFAADHQAVNRGFWMAGMAALLFAIGAWFFEGIFAGDEMPNGGEWWPVAVIALGAAIALRSVRRDTWASLGGPQGQGPKPPESTPPEA